MGFENDSLERIPSRRADSVYHIRTYQPIAVCALLVIPGTHTDHPPHLFRYATVQEA
jgi:hypothetical protein